ncbi:MAG: ATP-binding protein [Burkholderiales bacterium]|nr:ATP-binding protein [Burkholderiales bacterium]
MSLSCDSSVRPVGSARVLALLGAESTGKSTLAAQLTEALSNRGLRVLQVKEYLREFCDHAGRTPLRSEQAAIAAEQSRRIQAAAAPTDDSPAPDWVVADTTVLLTAVYSETVFGDRSLYSEAVQVHARQVDLTLLTALDLPWQADGLQRDGPQVRAPVDALLRSALVQAGIGFSVVAGHGPQRLAAAMAAWSAHERSSAAPTAPGSRRWRHWCARCGDPDCERHLFSSALRG